MTPPQFHEHAEALREQADVIQKAEDGNDADHWKLNPAALRRIADDMDGLHGLAEPQFTAEEVCDLAHITYRQLQYWIDAGHLDDPRPDELHGSGYGKARSYSLPELAEVIGMGALIKAGFTVKAAAESVSAERRPHWEGP
jgi:hypothetical protein